MDERKMMRESKGKRTFYYLLYDYACHLTPRSGPPIHKKRKQNSQPPQPQKVIILQ